MITLAKYDGMTRCLYNTWNKQKECDYSQQSKRTEICIWIREDGTCSNPNVCAEMVNN